MVALLNAAHCRSSTLISWCMFACSGVRNGLWMGWVQLLVPLRRHIPCPDARSHEHQDKPWEAILFVLMEQLITSGMSRHIWVVWEVDSYFALSWQFVVLFALCPHVWTFLDFARDLLVRMMTPDWASVSHTFAVCVRVGVLRGVLVIDILRCLTDR